MATVGFWLLGIVAVLAVAGVVLVAVGGAILMIIDYVKEFRWSHLDFDFFLGFVFVALPAIAVGLIVFDWSMG